MFANITVTKNTIVKTKKLYITFKCSNLANKSTYM